MTEPIILDQSEDRYIVEEITRIVRDADQAFLLCGGASRHWVRDCFLPKLNGSGWMISREEKRSEG